MKTKNINTFVLYKEPTIKIIRSDCYYTTMKSNLNKHVNIEEIRLTSNCDFYISNIKDMRLFDLKIKLIDGFLNWH